MRATLTRSLPDTATIQRRTRVSDDQGGQSDTWATASTNVPCRLSPMASVAESERILGAREGSQARWLATFPSGTDVGSSDRVVVGSRTFEVTQVFAPRSWELGRRVGLDEVL